LLKGISRISQKQSGKVHSYVSNDQQSPERSGAVKYFKGEYEHARGSYYAEDEKVTGQWSGELAERFELRSGQA
jgi:hypothetical protein